MEIVVDKSARRTSSFFNINFFSITLFLAFFLGNRKLTGSDSPAYEYIYETGVGFDRLENGYKWVSLVFQSHNYSFWALQLFLGILTVLIASVAFILWDTNSKFFQLLVFYSPFWYFMSFNGMRQGVATSFVYLGTVILWKTCQTNSWIKKIIAFLCFIVAYNFHHMAITIIFFVFVIWILNTMRIIVSGKVIKVLAVFLVPTLLLVPPIYSIQYALDFLSKFGLNYTSLLSVNGSSYEMAGKGLLFILLLLGTLLFSKNIYKYVGLSNYFQISIFMLMLLLLIFGSGMNAMRVFDYFLPVLSLFVGKLMKESESNIIIIGILYVFMATAFAFTMIQNTHQIIPYLGWS
ncbi:EpsG family protein [Leuconostoc mesenteroides]